MIDEGYRKTSVFLLWALSACFVSIAIWMAVTYFSQPELENALLYPEAGKPLPEFELRDAEGGVFDRRRLEGRWSFVFFGYTRCPDICPMTLQAMHEAAEHLRAGGGPEPQYVFISVDSKRDDIQQLKNYARYFDEKFLGVTGKAEPIKRVAKIFGAPFNYYTLKENPDFEYINHPASIYVVSPDARLFALLPAPHSPPAIARDFAVMRDHYNS